MSINKIAGMLKGVATIALMIVATGFGFAQNKTMTGNVTEDLGGMKEPIYGANVVVVNASNRTLTGAITDLNGDYILSIPAGEKNLRIQFSFIGMKTLVFDYTGQTKLDVQLESDSKMLTAVEITSKKIERDQMGVSFKEQTSATQKIMMSEITETAPVTSIEEALQGQMAGVDIIMGGDPGAKSAIRIRGTSTLSSSAEPLIVVDGIPVSANIDESFDFSSANEDDFGALLNISPADIESIEVLKDASATAIYGTAGGNGVLLINTKKGVSGKTNFSFSSKFSLKEEPSTIPLLNGKQYISMIEDAIWNTANSMGLSNASVTELLFNTKELLRDPTYRYYNEYNVDTDWLDEVRQNAWSWDNSLAITGGGDKATYRFSLNYLDDLGTTIGTEMKRLTAKLRVDYKFSDDLQVYTDFSYTNTDKDANAVENVRSGAQNKMPNQSPYYMNADGTRTTSYFTPTENFQGSFSSVDNKNNASGTFNPVAMVHDGYKNTSVREEKMTINVRYRFPFNLRYEGYVSMNMKQTNTDTFLPQSATGVIWTNDWANRSTEDISDNFSLQTQNQLMYSNTFSEKHSLIATAMVRTTSSHSSSASNVTAGNVSLDLSDPAIGSRVVKVGSGESENRKVEMIGQAVYTFDDRYVLRGTVNREGNSSMGKDKRFGTFPSVGLAWNVYNEPWMENQEWMTEGKVRVGWGMSGTAPSSGYYYLGAFSSLGSYMDMSAIQPSRMQLDKLKWESSEEWDFGVDLRLFDRFGFTFDYYDKYTKDCLIKDVEVPSTTGYSKIKFMNSGELSNKGYEARFDYDIFKNKAWKVSMNFNIARNINKVEEIPDNYDVEEDGGSYSFGNGRYATRVVKGDPIGSFYGYRYKGVYQNTEDTYAVDAKGNIMRDFDGNRVIMRNGATMVFPGDAKYEDINHDGVINESDIVYLGNSNPKLTGGAGFTVSYNNQKAGSFTVNALLHGRFGQKVVNKARMDMENMYGTNNQSTAVLSRWRNEGDDTDIPRALYGRGYNYLGSDRFVEDASYLRLKSISLSWRLPKRWLQPVGISGLSVFVTGYDLITWTDYSGQNPEVKLPSKATEIVQDNSLTPVSKRFACGINLNF